MSSRRFELDAWQILAEDLIWPSSSSSIVEDLEITSGKGLEEAEEENILRSVLGTLQSNR